MPAPVLAPRISVRQYRISVTDSKTFHRFGEGNEYNGSLLKNKERFSKLFTSHTFHRRAASTRMCSYRQIMETVDSLQQNLWRISSPVHQCSKSARATRAADTRGSAHLLTLLACERNVYARFSLKGTMWRTIQQVSANHIIAPNIKIEL